MDAHITLALLDDLDAAGVPVDKESASEGDIDSSEISGLSSEEEQLDDDRYHKMDHCKSLDIILVDISLTFDSNVDIFYFCQP